MKNILILILAILTTQHLKAQYFTEVTPSPFKDMFDGNSVFADVDGDGDLDLFIVGFASGESVILYKNDGNGNYTEDTGNSFEGVRLADVAVADVNGNGYMDLLISGRNTSNNPITKLYLNDGTGQYTLDNSVSFDEVQYGTVDFADFNGDGSPDVLITGENGNNINGIAKIYFNDGSGSFTEQTGTPLIGVDYSAVIILDVNGDNHLDIIISGDKGNPDYTTNLYINDGTGQFTLQNSGLLAINRGALAYADVDGDGDLDVVVSGRTTGSTKESKLFLNDGTGIFTELTSLALTGVEFASAGFSDINGDTYPDLIVSGLVSNNNRSSEMFINDGNGNFTLYPLNSIEPISQGSISFGDVDGDSDNDLLITGISTGTGMSGSFDKKITRLYKLCNLELNQPSLSPISATCSLDVPQAPTATDNCSGGNTTIIATTTTTFPITDTTISEIIWSYDNGNGLFGSQTQAIHWQNIDTSTTVSQETITANNTDNGVTYQWINCSNNTIITGETNSSFTPSQSGSYAVVVYQNGCQDTSSCKTIQLASLEELSSENFTIYPNPSSGNFSLNIGDQLLGKLEITIYSALGQRVYFQETTANSKQLSISCAHLEEGMYIVNITNGHQILTGRLIIK